MPVRVAALHLYPVKGLRGHDITESDVERCGFTGDRRWMLVNPAGHFLTQREYPQMARVVVTPHANAISLRTSGMSSIIVPNPTQDAEPIEVTVWRSTVNAAHAGSDADTWLSQALDMPCRLVYLSDPDARPVDPAYAHPHDRVSFADGFPVLLTSDISLGDLNQRLSQPVAMRRFRPNLVIAGAEPWAEDRWRRIKIGGVIFRLPKPCSRCSVTSVDQDTGERPLPREPLRTLATFRRTQGGIMFGQNMIPQTTGRIAVGDAVTILESGPSNIVIDTAQG